MAVQEQVPYVNYVGNGVTTAFAYPFKVLEAQDLAVILNDVTQPSGSYTVSGLGNDAGGTVTFPVAPGAGVSISLQSDVVLERTTDYQQNGDILAETQDNDFDRIWLALSSVRSLVGGAIRVPYPEQVQVLPKASLRTDRLLAFDPITGKPTVSDFTQTQVASAIAAAYAGSKGPLDALTFVQAGAGAAPISAQEKAREIVSVTDYYANGVSGPRVDPSGAIDSTAGIQAALAASMAVRFPPGTYKTSSTITLRDGQCLLADGKKVATINYVGAGTAVALLSVSGSGTRIFSNVIRGLLIQTSTGATGIDMDSVSEGWFEDVTVSGFLTDGIKLHSSTSGGCVYNRFKGVKVQSCGVRGFYLTRDGAGVSSYVNDNTFESCRANACPTGMLINGGNHNVVLESQIEVCTTGISITEPATATSNANTIAYCRFESNTTNVSVGANVTHTILSENVYIDGVPLADSGSRTQMLGTYRTAHKRVSQFQLPEGSFRYERTANGGTQVPAFVVHDSSSVNSPVTMEVHNPSTNAGASFYRARFGGDAGTIKFDVESPSGKLQSLGTTNGPVGSATLSAAATTVVNNTCVSAASLIFLQPANPAACTLAADKGIYVSVRTAGTSFTLRTGDGSAATGAEVFWYWLVN